MEEFKEYEEFHTRFHFRSKEHPELILTDKTEIHFIELKKFYKNVKFNIKDPLHRWLKFFDKETREEELKELIHMDEAIATAEKRIKRAQYSLEELRRYHEIEDAEREYISAISYATRKGLAEGKAEGEARFAKLVQCLLKEDRQEDLIKATQDMEIRQKYYREFGIFITDNAEKKI